MLKSAMTVYRSQWRYIRKNPQYREDYVRSRKVFQRFWGEPLLLQMVACAGCDEVDLALRYFWTLLQFYSEGLLHKAHQKTSRMMRRNVSD